MKREDRKHHNTLYNTEMDWIKNETYILKILQYYRYIKLKTKN